MTKILLGIIATLSIACAALGVTAHSRGLKLDTAALTHKTDADTIARLTQAGKDNGTTIADLLRRLDAAAGVQADTAKAASEAQSQLASTATARDAALATIRKLQGEIYARDRASAVWAAGHLSDRLTEQLRRQWQQAERDPGYPRAGCAQGAVCGDPGQPAGSPPLGTAADSGIPCANGCFTNEQLRTMLDDALDSRGRCIDQLDAIGRLSSQAVKATSPTKEATTP